jgi:hypothetical protein
MIVPTVESFHGKLLREAKYRRLHEENAGLREQVSRLREQVRRLQDEHSEH